MSRPKKTTSYDAYIYESFTIGKNPNEIWQAINAQEIVKEEPPILSRLYVYRRYWQWIKDGKPGLLESTKYKTEDGDIVIVWRLKEKG